MERWEAEWLPGSDDGGLRYFLPERSRLRNECIRQAEQGKERHHDRFLHEIIRINGESELDQAALRRPAGQDRTKRV